MGKGFGKVEFEFDWDIDKDEFGILFEFGKEDGDEVTFKF